MQRTSWMAVGLALAACHCESGPSPAPTHTIVLAQAEPAPPSSGVRTHMAQHFSAAAELQKSIARGRLADARAKAHWIASHDMDVPLSWRPYVDEMRYSALRIERSRDVATAGVEIGRLGRACSSCHQAHDVQLAFSSAAPTPDGATLEAQMRQHQWAAARLWEGLIGPDDRAWEDGARVMATTRLDTIRSAHAKPNEDVIALAQRLHEQATEAIRITNLDSRAGFFGEMMETCASCHTILRPTPVVSASEEK